MSNPLFAYWNEDHFFYFWDDWSQGSGWMYGSRTCPLYQLKLTGEWKPVSCVIHAQPSMWQTKNFPKCVWDKKEHWTRVNREAIVDHDKSLLHWKPYLIGEVNEGCRHVPIEVINGYLYIGGEKICHARGKTLPKIVQGLN